LQPRDEAQDEQEESHEEGQEDEEPEDFDPTLERFDPSSAYSLVVPDSNTSSTALYDERLAFICNYKSLLSSAKSILPGSPLISLPHLCTRNFALDVQTAPLCAHSFIDPFTLCDPYILTYIVFQCFGARRAFVDG
jgi:hypothetical protein